MNRFNRFVAVAATAVIGALAVASLSVVTQAAPSTPTPSVQAVKPVQPPPQIGGLSTRPLDLNRVIARPDTYELHPLLASDDLKYPHDICYGMITCCNSAWVQGCDVEFFENVCTYYGGEVVLNELSDGSINYECHEAQ